MAIFLKEEGILQYPLFIDYGQLSKEKELEACIKVHEKFNLPHPKIMNLNGFGNLISSGLTDRKMDLNKDAFLPNRNLLFLVAAGAYAFETKTNAVAIGLLDEKYHIFQDQTTEFLRKSQELVSISVGQHIEIIAPLMGFSKKMVIMIARKKGIIGTYSCHSGEEAPCGQCISCLEIKNSY